MKRYSALLTAVIVVFCFFPSCSRDKASVIFFGVDNPAGTLDPQIVSDPTACIIVRNCFEGLLRKDENGNIVNGVAESYKVSNDGMKYTFKLRKDAVWHLTSNAKEQAGEKLPENFDLGVTAYDFVFAFKRGVDPATSSGMAYMLANIAGAQDVMRGRADTDTLEVKAVNRYTLEIMLARPQSNFAEVLCEPVCMPCNEFFFNTCDGRYGTLIKFTLSNGPFYLSRLFDDSYRINKADDYCGSSPASLDAVWLYCEDEQQTAEKLETGALSGAVVNQRTFNKIKTDKNVTTVPSADVVRCFVMNTHDKVFSNQHIRQAFAAATDTADFAENSGKAAINGFLPSAVADKRVTVHPSAYNKRNVSALLTKALNDIKQDRISVTLLCEPEYEAAVRRLFQEWQKIFDISVELAVKTLSAEALVSEVKKEDFQIAFFPLQLNAENPYEYFGVLADMIPEANAEKKHKDSSDGKTENFPKIEEKDKINPIKKLNSELCSGGDKEFVNCYSQIEKELNTLLPIIPVWEENTYFVCSNDINGIIHFSGKDKLYFHKAAYIE